MSDNISITPGAGAVVATDNVGARHFQIAKLAHGADGTATLVSAASGLPVEVLGTVPVSDGGASLTVDGPLTDAQLRAAAVPVSGPLTDAQLRATAVPVSGPATDAQLRATPLPVSGPLTDAQLRAAAVPVSLASQPLPAGAATEATLATLAAATALEDAPSTSGDRGLVLLARRSDTDGALSGTDGDYEWLQVNAVGRLKVSAQPALAPLITGTITANGQTVFANVARQSNVMLHMVAAALVGHNSAFEGSIDSTNGTNGNWFSLQAVRSNANTIETATGVLAATPAYAWELSVNGLSFIRVRATAHTSGTATWNIQPAPYATEPIPAAQASATQPVSGTVTANIGTGSLAAGANAIGDVGIQVRANATGAASIHHVVSAATTNAAVIKASAGRVVGWCLSNNSTGWRYVKLHNIATTPTAGTGVVQTIGIPPGDKAECSAVQGLAFATGIGRTIVSGPADSDATALAAASEVVGDIFFA
jgi:hypothetical protein